MRATDRVVVVGGGHAGVQLVASLRESGYTGPLALLHGEDHPPYDRPGLSKDLLQDDDAEAMRLRGDTFFAARDIDLVAARAQHIDRERRHVVGDDGRRWAYDHLVLATGGVPRTLPVPGAELSGVVTLRTLDDAVTLRHRLATATRVAVIGGGFIGLEIAAAARAREVPVLLVEAADRLMGRVVTPRCSQMALEHHRSTGVDVRLGRGLAELRGAGRTGPVRELVLDDGTVEPADLAVVGVGMHADDRLARESGLETNRGILVDPRLRTSDGLISAIGDCAVVRDPATGSISRLESVQNAVDQARFVAAALLGDDGDYRVVPWFWSTQGSLKLQMAGLVQDTDHVVQRETGGRRSLLCFRDGRLAAVESINDPGSHLAARRLLERGVTPSLAELQEMDLDLRRYAKRALATEAA